MRLLRRLHPSSRSLILAKRANTGHLEVLGKLRCIFPFIYHWSLTISRDIGTAKEALGDNLPTPLQLPW